MVVRAFQNQLDAAFPEGTWAALVTGLRDGVRFADQVVETTPMLRFITGQDLRGHIRRAGVLHQLGEMCRRELLPFKAEAAKMPIGSWHWLEIRSKGLVAHIVRTDTKKEIPTITSNRQPKFLRNEYDLFEHGRIPPIQDILDQDEERYSTISFGTTKAGELTHAVIGMPSADGSAWLAFNDILGRQRPLSDDLPAPAPMPPDPTQKLKFLQKVEEMLSAGLDKKASDKKA